MTQRKKSGKNDRIIERKSGMTQRKKKGKDEKERGKGKMCKIGERICKKDRHSFFFREKESGQSGREAK